MGQIYFVMNHIHISVAASRPLAFRFPLAFLSL